MDTVCSVRVLRVLRMLRMLRRAYGCRNSKTELLMEALGKGNIRNMLRDYLYGEIEDYI